MAVPLPDEPGSAFYRARLVPNLSAALHLKHAAATASLTWSGDSAGYVVQFTPSLAPPVQWQTLSDSPLLINGAFQLTRTNLMGTAGFYRLVKP